MNHSIKSMKKVDQFRRHLKLAKIVTRILDDEFHIGPFHFGLDPILGLLPGIGDALSLICSLYLVWIAHFYQVPETVRKKIMYNVIFDFFLGFIPVLGDAADFLYKANVKNMSLLEKHLPAEIIEGEIIQNPKPSDS